VVRLTVFKVQLLSGFAMGIYCSCVKSKQIILLDFKGCVVSDLSTEVKFKSISIKCSIF